MDTQKKYRVLLAEDNELNRKIAAEIIRGEGILADEAVNGSQVVECVQSAPPQYYDAVFMDIQMPEKDGCQAAREIRKMDGEDKKRLPLIAMTANTSPSDLAQIEQAGMNGCIAKPMDIEDLYAALKKWILKPQ